MRSRDLKKQIHKLLSKENFNDGLYQISNLPAEKVISPLLSFFYNNDQLIRWRAVSAMGIVIAKLSEQNFEATRNLMRRLMWNLNDESGCVGWGSPEAMGEIMVLNERLASEYHKILISYIIPNRNYIENEALQQGVLWGIWRLAHARPEYVKNSIDYLLPFIESPNPVLRGLALWICVFYNKTEGSVFTPLKDDNSTFTLYFDGIFEEITISRLFKERQG